MSQTQNARTLSLDFTRAWQNRDARTLALPFGATNNGNPHSPATPPKPTKRRQIPAADWGVSVAGSLHQTACLAQPNSVQMAIVDVFAIANHVPKPVAGCLHNNSLNSDALAQCHHVSTNTLIAMAGCLKQGNSSVNTHQSCAANHYGKSTAHANCANATQTRATLLQQCAHEANSAMNVWANCAHETQTRAKPLSGCLNTRYPRAVAPPCEWYPIKLPVAPKPPKTGRVCGELPPSNRLPLKFARIKREYDSRRLPFNFTCNHDSVVIPALDSYMILHTITASADGEPLQLLSANISADTSGYYWSGDFTLPPDDFARLNLDTRRDDCLIELNLNGENFVILAESYRDNRQFGQRSYTVSGRSRTAKLGADYAVSHKGLVNQERNARQIADEALALTGIELDWQIDDWLVPANVYSLTDKTPIAVLADIAQAAGAFVESHPSDAKISIKPRWRVAAWALNNAAAAVSVPDNVIISISGQKQINAQANGVFVWGAHDKGFAADVWRDGTSREPRAAAQTHALYTAQEVCRMAGIAALSATGVHKAETVQLPLAVKYGLNRAELGRVWRFNEPNGAWQGIITGVSISIERDNDAISVMQSVNVDRYLGA